MFWECDWQNNEEAEVTSVLRSRLWISCKQKKKNSSWKLYKKYFSQLPESIRATLYLTIVSIATYSNFFYSKSFKLFKVLLVPVYFVFYFFNKHFLSERIVDVYKTFESDFIKSFGSLLDSKICHLHQYLTERKVEVNEILSIPPEPLAIYSKTCGSDVEIPVPSSPIFCRLFCGRRNRGKVKTRNKFFCELDKF